MRLQIILCSWIIHFFNKGLSYAYTSERYVCPYETIINIAIAFEENGQLVSKHRSGVHYPILQDVHIQWLVERLNTDPNIIVESFHHQLNEVFQFPYLVSITCDLKAIQNQVEFTLKLMRYELNDNNNDEHLRECIE